MKPLWGASEVARYLQLDDDRSDTGGRAAPPVPFSDFAGYIQPDRVIPDIVVRYLRPIEQFAIDNLKGSFPAIEGLSRC